LKANLHKTEKKTYNKKNVHLEPTHAWDKSLGKHRISSTKATGATKAME
jgi:hypothetical protein